ncbi:uncharacterized protein LOC109859488 [Pseudomyrmex gracilis]|uniref:uncharacterized protein LOC109859488 n=1 Tax=Pseudomyrmex gracilis TaxID=219809 RepID=UPI00099496E3|nr:uncharacterized protein LOC109859488 [Pseudomyrmex gracilis]
MGIGFVSLIVIAMIPMITGNLGQRVIGKRNTVGNDIPNIDYLDYAAKYDDYPIVVPKRAALLFDQLMVALQKVVDNQAKSAVGRGVSRSAAPVLSASPEIVSATEDHAMDLQRRGQSKGQVYWRCYFNAVTCFKRK